MSQKARSPLRDWENRIVFPCRPFVDEVDGCVNLQIPRIFQSFLIKIESDFSPVLFWFCLSGRLPFLWRLESSIVSRAVPFPCSRWAVVPTSKILVCSVIFDQHREQYLPRALLTFSSQGGPPLRT